MILDLLLREDVNLPEHLLENYMAPIDLHRTLPLAAEQTSMIVYVDYILGVVKNDNRSLIWRVSRAALPTIHSIFLLPESSGHLAGKTQSLGKSRERQHARFDIET